jgi:hypothetical protein
MKTNFLLPHRYKKIGWILLAPALVLWACLRWFNVSLPLDAKVLSLWPTKIAQLRAHSGADADGGASAHQLYAIVKNNLTDELTTILAIVALAMIAFSKEKIEDEYIAKIRLDSLLNATYVNYLILIFCILFFYEFSFLSVLIYNMFTLLIVFVVRYHYVLYKSKFLNHEK